MNMYLNIEIKARCHDLSHIREILIMEGAEFKGVDEQTDTYFNATQGRLKLREGNIENNLIYYERADHAGPRDSNFKLVKVENAGDLKNILSLTMGIKVTVHKKREIYYIKNVKFHLDEVPGLGSFVEIEAGNMLADLKPGGLKEQCDHYVKMFGIEPADMVKGSYSDLV